MAVEKKSLSLKGVDLLKLAGIQDSNLNVLREHFPGKLVLRGDEIHITGEKEDIILMEKIIALLKEKLKRDGYLYEEDIIDAIHQVKGTGSKEKEEFVIVTPKKKIVPKSENQRRYLEAIEKNDIVVAIGPAGTGKTFLAVAMALKFLRERRVERIILTRPAVEAGESLGFLPGDFQEKINPYLTPLYDALYAMMPPDRVRRLLDTRVIEIAPLAYMRGRTLSDAFVILDEAQNTKSVQMKMFLTRLGPRSKAVLTGDITQIDLAHQDKSGLVEIQDVLRDIKGITFIYFGPEDVIRHSLVKQIVEAYERHSQKSQE